MKRKVLAIAVLMTICATSYAEESNFPVDSEPMMDNSAEVAPPEPLRYLLGVGLTTGGDKLVTVAYSDGSTDSVTAGGFYSLYGGMDYRLNENLSLRGSIGYHFDTTKPADNGEVTFGRVPLELMAYYHASSEIRIGGGTRIVLSPKMEGTGVASAATMSFNNTLGIVGEAEYMFTHELGISLRYVIEKYKASGISSTINGNHLGLMANIYL